MKKELFDELAASVKEAGKIHRGKAKASREFHFDPEDVRAIRAKLQKTQSASHTLVALMCRFRLNHARSQAILALRCV